MIVADSGVWIDFINGISTAKTARLRDALETEPVLMGDLILCEILRGARSERDAAQIEARLAALEFRAMGGRRIAVQAARNYRNLRGRGITVRKLTDLLIATFCIMHGHRLLHADRDYDPLAAHLGLQVVA